MLLLETRNTLQEVQVLVVTVIANAGGQSGHPPSLRNPGNSNCELPYLNSDFDRKFGKHSEGKQPEA